MQKLPKSTVKLTITVPADQVKVSQEKVLAEIVKDAEVDGFRKGKAPAELVKQKINPQKFDSEVISDLVKTFYPQALEEQKIAPIISPKIEIESYDSEKDFTFSAQTAIRPDITVGDYKKAIKELYDKKTAERTTKKEDSEEGGSKKSPEQDHVHLSPTDIVDAILTVTQVELPDMVLDEEVDRMLSRLVQQLQPLNLGMDAYLKSINKTGDQVRQEYAQVAFKNVASEMALVEIVKKEQVEVDDKEIEATAGAMGDEKLKERYMSNPVEKAYITAIIAKNKLIWKLISETEGEGRPHDEDNKNPKSNDVSEPAKQSDTDQEQSDQPTKEEVKETA